jgi:hypothetical protein
VITLPASTLATLALPELTVRVVEVAAGAAQIRSGRPHKIVDMAPTRNPTRFSRAVQSTSSDSDCLDIMCFSLPGEPGNTIKAVELAGFPERAQVSWAQI